jgi:hypothetical protein
MRRRLWRQWWQQCPHAGGGKSVQWTIQRERVGGGGEGGCRDKAVAMFMHGAQAADDMPRGGGQWGRSKASGKRTTRQEGGGVGRCEASGRRTTQQEGCRRGGRRWWNPPMQVSTNVDAIVYQLPSRQDEKEGWGPIVVEAGERFTSTTRTPRARMTATTMLSSWQRL